MRQNSGVIKSTASPRRCIDKARVPRSISTSAHFELCRTGQHHYSVGTRGPALRCVYTNIHKKAGPFSAARLKMDLPFHKRLAFTGEAPALLSELFYRKSIENYHRTCQRPPRDSTVAPRKPRRAARALHRSILARPPRSYIPQNSKSGQKLIQNN